jgi:MoxR-like ATPase
MDTIPADRPLIELAQCCHRADVPLKVFGPHGVGKSELLQQAADELSIGCVVFDLSVMEPTDLVSLPREKDGRTVYCPPDELPREGQGLLVFEELIRAPHYVRAPCLQLLTARKINGYRLPAGWLPVAAIKPPDPEACYEVTELDPALLSRFVQVRVRAVRDVWLIWARQQGIHHDVLNYIAADPAVFESPASNPRGWTYISRFLSAHERDDGGFLSPSDPSLLRTDVCSLVGSQRAASFLRFLRDP